MTICQNLLLYDVLYVIEKKRRRKVAYLRVNFAKIRLI